MAGTVSERHEIAPLDTLRSAQVALTPLRGASILLLTSLLFLTAEAGEFFISPTGSDRNPGTRQRPFLTLERARDAVRALKKESGGSAKERISVWLAAGTYPLARTFEIGPGESGSPAYPVTYAAMPGARVRLSGGVTIPPPVFHRVRDAGALRRLPDSSKPFVMEADLRSLGIHDFGTERQFGFGLPVVPASLELFWNDTAMQIARYPNRGGIQLGVVIDPGSTPRTGDHTNRGGTFRYTDARHA
ncbi:MAG TPA: hypothetical protein VMF59_00280, partial [Bacteroidota bacterium]|nr:hypothetical protein [Bacteroidota bacterium]